MPHEFFFILKVHKNYTLITKYYMLLIFLQLQFISYMRQINDKHISMLNISCILFTNVFLENLT